MNNLFRITACLVLPLMLLAVQSCNVHEWPEPPERVQFRLQLEYSTGMSVAHYSYDGGSKEISILSDEIRNYEFPDGDIRYIIRAYPLFPDGSIADNFIEEYSDNMDASSGYDCTLDLDLPAGEYRLLVWADLREHGNEEDLYHDTGDFGAITLCGEHVANSDLRDAFRGTADIKLAADFREQLPETFVVNMERPLAKYEFVSNDLQEFIEMQAQLAAAKNNSGSLSQSAEVDLSDFKVVFSYFGYMPDTYSMFTDKPVDSATGVTFESRIIQTGDNEASLGFDYIFVNGQQTATTVQIAIYDSEGNQLSLTDPVEVPLARSCHSIMHGQFLLSNAAGGIGIDPGFDGDHNIVIP